MTREATFAGRQGFIATLLFDHSMQALPIVETRCRTVVNGLRGALFFV